jgi:glutaminyl-peptide cyclotransferase
MQNMASMTIMKTSHASRGARSCAALGRIGAALLLAATVAESCGAQPSTAPTGFSGTRALADVRQLVAIGPRVAGTPGAAKARDYITSQLKAAGLAVEEQPFDAPTPRGTVHMVNLTAVIPGLPARDAPSQVPVQRLVVAGHYDTKLFQEFTFVGANDGGSSAAFLIELARAVKPRTLPMDVELLFVDGEEAVVEWQGNDHTYGSRHYVQAARSAGTLKTIGALVLVDMIGDKDLRILREANSTPWLTETVWSAAAKLGRREFVTETTPIEDDHLEFLEAGVPAVDIIDLDYPAWHRAEDTLDKLSPASFQAVGDVVVAALGDIAARGRQR